MGERGLAMTSLRARPATRPVVVTGGFDVLHVGHVRFLAQVRSRGLPLLVGVESDERIRSWKGPTRPINSAAERAEVLAALRAVDDVFIISGPPDAVSPRHYVELLHPLDPAALAFTEGDPFSDAKGLGAAELGAEVWELPLTEARSTTAVLNTALADTTTTRPHHGLAARHPANGRAHPSEQTPSA